jgi:D-alanine-D-alanine ligase
MKKNIAVITGGTSSEYVVSLRSATNVANALNKDKYNVYIVNISKQGWFLVEENRSDLPIDKNDFSVIVDGIKINFDAAFFALHGAPGENGLLQAYFELVGIPYSTGDTLNMSLTFNKYACNSFLRPLGIPVAESILIRKGEQVDAQAIVAKLGLPCFAKPNSAGSSFGVSKIKSAADVLPALEKAYAEDNEVVIERYLSGREFTCGVCKTATKSLVMPITEIVSKNEFFDYQAKYTPEFVSEITPAEIDVNLAMLMQTTAERVYDLVNCRGIARVDFIVDNGIPYVLEINTIPGMTSTSLVPQQIRAMNLTQEQVFEWVLEDTFLRDKQ